MNIWYYWDIFAFQIEAFKETETSLLHAAGWTLEEMFKYLWLS